MNAQETVRFLNGRPPGTVTDFKQTAQQELERLLGRVAAAPGLEAVADRLSVLCRAYMASDLPGELDGVSFTRMQRRYFNILRAKCGRIVSKEALLDAGAFDNPNDGPDLKVVEVRICHMRKKLEAAGAPYWIETVWTNGYRLHNEPLPDHIKAKTGMTKYWLGAQRAA